MSENIAYQKSTEKKKRRDKDNNLSICFGPGLSVNKKKTRESEREKTNRALKSEAIVVAGNDLRA